MKTENFSLPMVSWFSEKNMSRKSPSFPTLSNPLGRVVSPWPGRRLFPTLPILKTRRCLDDVPLSKTTCSLAAWLKLSQDSQTSEHACWILLRSITIHHANALPFPNFNETPLASNTSEETPNEKWIKMVYNTPPKKVNSRNSSLWTKTHLQRTPSCSGSETFKGWWFRTGFWGYQNNEKTWIWVNYHVSLTWNKAGDDSPIHTFNMIPVRSL
jgi:hypothetical protein